VERGSVELSVMCDGRQGGLLRPDQEGVVCDLARVRPTQILYHPWESATNEAQQARRGERHA
jgi:hypothetical protein